MCIFIVNADIMPDERIHMLARETIHNKGNLAAFESYLEAHMHQIDALDVCDTIDSKKYILLLSLVLYLI